MVDQEFAQIPNPVGLAVTTTELLATEWGNTSIFTFNSDYYAELFATVPVADPNSNVNNIAISPGLAGFTKNAVFEAQGPFIFAISPDGSHVRLFATLPNLPYDTADPSGITFDTVGSFGYQLIVTAAWETVDTIASNGTVTQIAQYAPEANCPTACFFDPTVAPLSFGVYSRGDEYFQLGGDLLVPTGGSVGGVWAITPQGFRAFFGNWTGATSVAVAPPKLCGLGGSEGPSYFFADNNTSSIDVLPAYTVDLPNQTFLTSANFEGVTPVGIGNLSVYGGEADSFYSSSDSIWAQAFVSCPAFGQVVQIQHGNWYPYEMAYDPMNKDMYVTDNMSNQVYFFNPKSEVIGQATVGNNSTGVAYDPANQEMLVSNSASDNVSIFNATTNEVTGSIPVGGDPQGIAYNPGNGDMYVADNGTNNLTVINPDNQAIASVATGADPFGVAYSAMTGFIYTADFGGSITVVSGTTELTTIGLDGSATGIVQNYPTTGGRMWATVYGDSQVARIGNSLRFPVVYFPAGGQPFGIAYDPKLGELIVANHASGTLTIIRGPTTIVETVQFGEPGGPWGVAYDPANGLIYVAGELVGDPRTIGGGGA